MELDTNLLIAAGIAAGGCIAIGLIVGLVRGHFVSDRLRGELTAINDGLKAELAEARSHIRGLSVELEQNRGQLREALSQARAVAERLAEATGKFNTLRNDPFENNGALDPMVDHRRSEYIQHLQDNINFIA